MIIPFGIRAPKLENLRGDFRYSINSCISSFSSSHPATSENLTLTFSSNRAGDLEKSNACLFALPAPILTIIKYPKTTKINNGTIATINSIHIFLSFASTITKLSMLFNSSNKSLAATSVLGIIDVNCAGLPLSS